MDPKKAEEAVRELLQNGLGLDLSNPNLCGTPERVARMYVKEFLASCYKEPTENLARTFPNEKGFDEILMFDNIPFTSLCVHHFLPFSGFAWLLYVPDKELIGASKSARIIDYFSRTPQLQENLAVQIIDFIEEAIKPKGSMLVMRAVHGCMSCRGVKTGLHAGMTVSVTRGIFRTSLDTRTEALNLIQFSLKLR